MKEQANERCDRFIYSSIIATSKIQHAKRHSASERDKRAYNNEKQTPSETTEIKTIVMCVQMCAIKIVGRRPSS